jgi:hypothetical protein
VGERDVITGCSWGMRARDCVVQCLSPPPSPVHDVNSDIPADI